MISKRNQVKTIMLVTILKYTQSSVTFSRVTDINVELLAGDLTFGLSVSDLLVKCPQAAMQ